MKHAFEFITARPMTPEEAEDFLPELESVFDAQGRKIWPVMRHVVAKFYRGENP